MTLGRVTIFTLVTVVHSFTHVRSSIQDKEYRCLSLESTQRLELASNMTEDVWWDSNFQKDGQSECFSMRAMFKNPLSLSRLSRSAGVLERSSSRHRYTVLF